MSRRRGLLVLLALLAACDGAKAPCIRVMYRREYTPVGEIAGQVVWDSSRLLCGKDYITHADSAAFRP